MSQELEDSLAQDAEELPSAAVLRRPHREWEPLRTKLGFVYHRLGNTLTPARARARLRGRAGAAARPRAGARHVNSRHVATGAIRRLLWQVDVFGFHLAGIDIRQGADVVREATGAVLPGFADADNETRRIALLTEALASGRRGIEHDPGGEAGELLRMLDTVALSAEAYGPQTVPAFVISMTEQPSDVLAAHWLAQRARATSLRMVPLFETRARRSKRRRRRWPSCTRSSPTSRTCARRPTARR